MKWKINIIFFMSWLCVMDPSQVPNLFLLLPPIIQSLNIFTLESISFSSHLLRIPSTMLRHDNLIFFFDFFFFQRSICKVKDWYSAKYFTCHQFSLLADSQSETEYDRLIQSSYFEQWSGCAQSLDHTAPKWLLRRSRKIFFFFSWFRQINYIYLLIKSSAK